MIYLDDSIIPVCQFLSLEVELAFITFLNLTREKWKGIYKIAQLVVLLKKKWISWNWKIGKNSE